MLPMLIAIALGCGAGHMIGRNEVWRKFRREQSCSDPIHRAEAAQKAAIRSVESWVVTAVCAVSGCAVWLPGWAEPTGWAIAIMSVVNVIMIVLGAIGAAVWSSGRMSRLDLNVRPCRSS